PAKGVYAVDVLIDQSKYRGMMNIGRRPTFDFDPLTLEVHLFNFYADLYEKALSIRFKKFIRPEKKFTGIEELRAQLANDKIKCEQI
ncbi:MAG: riboflavin biosynthesis protein RibF, partial [Calditrichae bacterium]|nr:riboflavin biosynthesis protein RibF [Calditrichia bacterium]NIW78690.1 riboflavin biosynthesis protein RibF [Calditrichia bacterium]